MLLEEFLCTQTALQTNGVRAPFVLKTAPNYRVWTLESRVGCETLHRDSIVHPPPEDASRRGTRALTRIWGREEGRSRVRLRGSAAPRGVASSGWRLHAILNRLIDDCARDTPRLPSCLRCYISVHRTACLDLSPRRIPP